MTDNSTASGIMNKTAKQNCTGAIDMRFYWVRNRCTQKHFIIYWQPRVENLGDYHTKHHPTAHHKHVYTTYLHKPAALANLAMCLSPSGLQGCDESREDQTTKAHNPG
eukprot:540495-Ditylum_brightwellii.AAC.1